MTAMFPSSWRSPAAGVRLLSRSICWALSSMRSAAVFSSTRVTRLVPGIGAEGKGDRHDGLVLICIRSQTFYDGQRPVHADHGNVAAVHHAGGSFVHRVKVALTLLKRIC